MQNTVIHQRRSKLSKLLHNSLVREQYKSELIKYKSSIWGIYLYSVMHVNDEYFMVFGRYKMKKNNAKKMSEKYHKSCYINNKQRTKHV